MRLRLALQQARDTRFEGSILKVRIPILNFRIAAIVTSRRSCAPTVSSLGASKVPLESSLYVLHFTSARKTTICESSAVEKKKRTWSPQPKEKRCLPWVAPALLAGESARCELGGAEPRHACAMARAVAAARRSTQHCCRQLNEVR